MKLRIETEDTRNFHLSIPRWLYMNSLAVSIITLRREIPISPRQARKSLRAVKRAMRSGKIKTIVEIEVNTADTQVHIEV